MGAVRQGAGQVASGVKDVAKEAVAPKAVENLVGQVGQKAGVNWNPITSIREEAMNPGSGAKGALGNAGWDISHAWQTSVNNPLNNLAGKAEDLWSQIMGRTQAPTMPTMPGMPQVGGVGVGGPGGPGGMAMGGGGGATAQTLSMMPEGNMYQKQQTALVNQLAGQANGTGPSIAANQLKAGQEANIAATMAQANSGRGGYNPAMARAAMQQGAEVRGGMAQQAATARLQEQQAAAGLLGQTINQSQQAALQSHQLNLGAQQQTQDMQKAQMQLQAQYAQMGMDAQKANQLAALEVAKLQQQGVLGIGALQMQAGAAQNAILGGIFGAAGQGFAAMMS